MKRKTKLLSQVNSKTEKGEELGVMTLVLRLAPAKKSGYNMCPWSTPECEATCLDTAGNGRFTNVQKAQVNRTLMFKESREEFLARLYLEIAQGRLEAQLGGFELAVRLNCTSDVLWELVLYKGKSMMEHFPDIQFYDYTKCPLENRTVTSNYHLTFSFDGENEEACKRYLSEGYNVAVPYDGKQELPKSMWGFEAVDGDRHDLRYKEKPATVSMLKAKGRLRGKLGEMSFVVDLAEIGIE